MFDFSHWQWNRLARGLLNCGGRVIGVGLLGIVRSGGVVHAKASRSRGLAK
jgi:hypothetical protein